MKRLVRDRNTVEMLEAFQDKLSDLTDVDDVESSTHADLGFVDDWEKLETKSVMDSDGFYTEYSLWFNHETGEYVTIFGDTDLYDPLNSVFDMEFGTNADEAYEWFEDYNGFEDEDI